MGEEPQAPAAVPSGDALLADAPALGPDTHGLDAQLLDAQELSQPTEPTPAPGEGSDESAAAASLHALAAESAGLHAGVDYSLPQEAAERDYRTKQVNVFGRDVTIVLQNTNGPCPLLAIANALALRGAIPLRSSGPPFVPHSELVALVAAALLDNGAGGSASASEAARAADANTQQNISDAVLALPKLATGLDVNVRFTDVRAFEFTGETAIFDLLRLPLVHGWLVDPTDRVTAAAVGGMSYNALVERLVSGEAPPEQALALQAFLESSASQLTPYGLSALHDRIADNTLAVFFRNNHFCTAYKHRGGFYLLVTDEGYRDQSQLVWEALSTVDGDTSYVTGAFEPFVAPEPQSGAALGALTDAAAVAAADGAPAVTDEERAILRQMQEEEDMRTAQLLSQQLSGQAAGSAHGAGAAAAGAGAGDGFEMVSGVKRSHGADIGDSDVIAQELFAAAEAGDLERAMVALASGQHIDSRDVLGRTPLHWAASAGREEMAAMLVANGALLAKTDDNGHTPLHLAAMAGSTPLVQMLLDAGSNPAARDRLNKTPIQLAQDPAVVSLLQSHPAAIAAAQRNAAQAAAAQVSGARSTPSPQSSTQQQSSQQRRGHVMRRNDDAADADSGGPQWLRGIKQWFQN